MKLLLPLAVLSTVVALTAAGGHHDDNSNPPTLSGWKIDTSGMTDGMVSEFNDDIKDCVKATHTNYMFKNCIEDHLHYYDSHDMSHKQQDDIRAAADKSNVHGHGHGHSLRGV